MEKVLVTGATGFIGRQAIPLLKSHGLDVHAITSKNSKEGLRDDISWHLVDIFDSEKIAELCRQVRPTHLLHLAWHNNLKDRFTSPINIRWVEASYHLVREFTQNEGKKIVIAGSCQEYDWRYGYCTEQFTPTDSFLIYGKCKILLNELIDEYAQENGIHYANGRIFFLYGPHQDKTRLIPYVIKSLLMDEKAKLSECTQIRDYLHVADVANALVELLLNDVTGSVNIASGQPTSLHEVVDIIGKSLNKMELIEYGAIDSKNDFPVVFGNTSRLQNELGWVPKYSLEEGIEDTINWWKRNLEKTII
ncbi:NAD(P)-dependent oxidoreductase [Aliifodinibius sp. S!AR15-10]|uniref:NAD-dependent epimerase/dehydratase family protein n=1 Tax=Aliifodinibius sp. S!AR15-10 TaxID=2950437 RepID=UPI002865A195|nr:NAD(P)-dependent oxidoreductase [Aliifodinibius sp. S!AR15-10]MDR8390234.1 NAD(P)-dependent oxidoreductase [Aliifodinibius sp. S!AR15-10]